MNHRATKYSSKANERLREDLRALPKIGSLKLLRAALWLALGVALLAPIAFISIPGESSSLAAFCILTIANCIVGGVLVLALQRLADFADSVKAHAIDNYHRGNAVQEELGTVSVDLEGLKEESGWSSQSLEETLPTTRAYERLLPKVAQIVDEWDDLRKEVEGVGKKVGELASTTESQGEEVRRQEDILTFFRDVLVRLYPDRAGDLETNPRPEPDPQGNPQGEGGPEDSAQA